jgi:hypothetical protein
MRGFALFGFVLMAAACGGPTPDSAGSTEAEVRACPDGDCGCSCADWPGMDSWCSAGGACHYTCSDGLANCDGRTANGCEAVLSNDVNNCGSCGHVCSGGNAYNYCSNSVCHGCSVYYSYDPYQQSYYSCW